MIRIPKIDKNAPSLVVTIGNSHTYVGTWQTEQLKTPLRTPTGDLGAFRESFEAHVEAMNTKKPAAAVIGSVVPAFCNEIAPWLEEKMDQQPLIIGANIPLPMDVAVEDPRAVGVDRVCAAAAVYDTLESACIIVDFGTATTVDVVDDDGVFLGGAILPGIATQLEALSRDTAQLPLVRAAVPELPFGRNTEEAIQTGVCRGMAGAVRGLVEGYATWLNRWPQVVATGGDIELLAPCCDFIDSWTRDLALKGVGIAFTRYMQEHGA